MAVLYHSRRPWLHKSNKSHHFHATTPAASAVVEAVVESLRLFLSSSSQPYPVTFDRINRSNQLTDEPRDPSSRSSISTTAELKNLSRLKIYFW